MAHILYQCDDKVPGSSQWLYLPQKIGGITLSYGHSAGKSTSGAVTYKLRDI